ATNRGYTGHEMIDGLDVVHMNGRVYDNRIGRFLQVDPFVQEPGNAQNHNRYTYLWNNPLNATDPSGYIGVKERQWAAAVVTIIAAAYCGPCGASWYASFATGAVTGGIATGSWKGALYGGLTAAAFYGIGSGYAQVVADNAKSVAAVRAAGFADYSLKTVGNTGLTFSQIASKVVAHGATGGVMSALQGGNFGNGFASAALTQAAGSRIDNIGNVAGRVATAALVGGSVSVLTGGKFANGAITAAFSRAFNDEAHRRQAAARQKGEELLDPYASGYDITDPNYHRYAIGPSALCTVGESGCSFNALALVVAENSVPFVFRYSGPGAYNLPFGTGTDPIQHRTPDLGVWLNRTLEGHRYHPGVVAHGLYESGGKMWLYSIVPERGQILRGTSATAIGYLAACTIVSEFACWTNRWVLGRETADE
ncbi:MAG: RHS repeat-associated core domain-containing protein, partial [Pseudomarimonas sp.]